MSRADFFRKLNSSPKDGLNDVMIRQVVPEIISELNDVKKLNSEIIPSLADDVWKAQNRIGAMDLEIAELNKRATILEREINSCKALVSSCDSDLKEFRDNASSSFNSTQNSISGILSNISELRQDLKKVQNRKVVFSLDSSAANEGETPG
jgi:chromosome segregation ATPase